MITKFKSPNNATNSPWLNPSCENLFRTELEYAQLDLHESPEKVNPLFKYVIENQCADLLFNAFNIFAPLLPVGAGSHTPPIFLSPPLSGAGDQVHLVVGKDDLGKMRIVGGNDFYHLDATNNEEISSGDFFYLMGFLGLEDKRLLVQRAVACSMVEADFKLVARVINECRRYRTVPILVTVLDGHKSYFCVFPALAYGKRSSNYNLRFFGEVL